VPNVSSVASHAPDQGVVGHVELFDSASQPSNKHPFHGDPDRVNVCPKSVGISHAIIAVEYLLGGGIIASSEQGLVIAMYVINPVSVTSDNFTKERTVVYVIAPDRIGSCASSIASDSVHNAI
jgi:hypothetical protein